MPLFASSSPFDGDVGKALNTVSYFLLRKIHKFSVTRSYMKIYLVEKNESKSQDMNQYF